MQRVMRRKIVALTGCFVVAVLTTSGAWAQDVGPQEVITPIEPRALAPEEPEAEPPEELLDIYERLANYWEAEDARAISDLAREGRVFVVVQRENVSGRLATSQLRFLLQDLFDSSDEVTFRFPATSHYNPRDGSGYAVGERVFQEAPGMEAHIDRVFVGARYEGGRWVLTELRLTIK